MRQRHVRHSAGNLANATNCDSGTNNVHIVFADRRRQGDHRGMHFGGVLQNPRAALRAVCDYLNKSFYINDFFFRGRYAIVLSVFVGNVRILDGARRRHVYLEGEFRLGKGSLQQTRQTVLIASGPKVSAHPHLPCSESCSPAGWSGNPGWDRRSPPDRAAGTATVPHRTARTWAAQSD